MFDTMTMTKVIGGFCGALLIFLLVGWAGEELFHVGDSGHGDEHHYAYNIETGDDGHGDEAEEAGPDFATLLAEANAENGARVFRKCQACHSAEDGDNGTGPHLFGVVDRAIASVDGFNYSGTLAGMSSDAWTAENLSAFLESPRSYAPGTAMSFAGLGKIEDRVNLIAYLQTIGN